MSKWKKLNNNFLLQFDGFYISYNPDTTEGHRFTDLGNTLLAIGGSKEKLKDGEETALIKENEFYILNGDFRNEYEHISEKGFMECYLFFKSKEEKFGSNWTTKKNLFKEKN